MKNSSCKCSSIDPYKISKCTNCGCIHFRVSETKPPTANVGCEPTTSLGYEAIKNICQTWVDHDSIPKRKDIVPPKPPPKQTSGDGQKVAAKRTVNNKAQKNRRKTSKSPPPPTPAPSPAQPSAPNIDQSSEKRSSSVLPDKTEATNANGDKIEKTPTEASIIPPTGSQSDQILAKSNSSPGNFEFTETFCCFLKKVKSTEMFIRNLFKEETPKSNSCPCPPTDNRAACGVCVNDTCQKNSALVGSSCGTPQTCNKTCDTGAGKNTNQNVDLSEIKNTVDCLKEMMAKQLQNGNTHSDDICQKILSELKKHIQQDDDKKLCTLPANNVLAVIEESAPFAFVKCKPFCDQHGVFIVEWRVTSFLGIGGYEIFVDGILKQSISSAIRNTALIPGVNPKCEHLVTVAAVPLPDCNLNSNDKWTPANCRYKPIQSCIK